MIKVAIVLKAVKVRIYPTDIQQTHLAQAFGCVRWVWNQSLSVMSLTYKETGKGLSALSMKKQIPVVIVVEDLAVKNMVKNHNLAKSISDAGWGMFCTMLKYKAEQDGKTYLEIGRFFPSSHLCHVTLRPIPKMDLSVRSFPCPHCNVQHDRDVNAAINIRNEGLQILALGTSATALGGNVRPKRFGRKSTTAEAIADELGSQHHTA